MLKQISQFFGKVSAVVDFRQAMRENDLVAARQHYANFQNSKNPRLVAMGARLHLEERNFEKAKVLLEQAFSLASRKKNKRNRYICEYCRYYLSRIDGDQDHLDYWLNGHKLKPSNSLFDSLPLYRTDRFEDPNLIKAKAEAANKQPD